MSAYKRVCKALGEAPHGEPVRQGLAETWPDGPVLCRDFEGWYSDYRWAIVWETGDDWPLRDRVHKAADRGGRVYSESVNGWALALFPA